MPLATEIPRRPVRSTPTPIYLLGLKVWGCCILHLGTGGMEMGCSGVERGSLPKTDPKGTLSTDAHLPIGQRRCCRGRDAISSRWSVLVKPVAPSLLINIGQGGAVWVHFGGGGIVIEPHTPAIYHGEEQVWFGWPPSDPDGRKWHTPGEVPTCTAAHRYFSNLP